MTDLERLLDAERTLAELSSATDARDLVDMAEAARVLAKQIKAGTGAVNHATVVKVRAERRLADLVDDGQANGTIATQGRESKVRSPDLSTLAELGLSKQRLTEARLLRDHYTDADLLNLKADADAHDREIARQQLLAKAKRTKAKAVDTAARTITPADGDTHGDNWTLLAGDFRDRLNDIEPGTVDLIVTDPPYPAEFLPLWSDLSEHAARVLRPQGIVVAMTGKIMLPDVIARLGEHLAFGWVYCQPLPGANSRILARHTLQSWKPWLAYSNGKWPSGRIDWHPDLLAGVQKSKDNYSWEQSSEPCAELICHLAPPDGTVLDPFTGSGSYGIASLDVGRKFIGVEMDADRHTKATERLTGA